MLTLTRRSPAGNWYIRGTVAGRHVYESTGVKRRADADAIRARRQAEIIQIHAQGRAAALTFAEAAATYMQAGGERRFLAPILRHFGADMILDDIDNAAVTAAAEAIYPTAAAATINRQLITPISAVITMAADEGLARPRRLRRRKGDRTRTRWLTPAEADRLIEAAAPHVAPLIACLIGTGARVSEALQIEARHYHAETGEIWIPDTKNGHPRMIRAPGRARAMIEARGLPETGPIFLTPKRRPYVIRAAGGGQIATAFRHACDVAGLGLDVTPHVLRHTWATWFYAQTHDFGGLLDLGGWQKADMAQRYRKIAPGDLGDRLAAHGWDFRRP